MRTGYYIRYKDAGNWRCAVVETLTAKNALTISFEEEGRQYDYHGRVELPPNDGDMIGDFVE